MVLLSTIDEYFAIRWSILKRLSWSLSNTMRKRDGAAVLQFPTVFGFGASCSTGRRIVSNQPVSDDCTCALLEWRPEFSRTRYLSDLLHLQTMFVSICLLSIIVATSPTCLVIKLQLALAWTRHVGIIISHRQMNSYHCFSPSGQVGVLAAASTLFQSRRRAMHALQCFD